MADHDLQIQTDDGSTVIVTVTPLAGDAPDGLADDVAAILTQEYGEDVRET
jgi:hypothetical protein